MSTSAKASSTSALPKDSRRSNGAELNRLEPGDRPAHDWYRFVLSYPPHLVREYVRQFELSRKARVLDPFCGTGTTVVECKKLGLASVGIEAHPMSHFAGQTKVDWSVDADRLEQSAIRIAEAALTQLERAGIIDDPQPSLH